MQLTVIQRALSHCLFGTFLLSAVTVGGQTGGINSWTKPNSGYWEEPFWSLGRLPDATQGVVFTNAGWKALAIGAATAQNFPQSMSVQSLQVASPVDSYNTLLMNWSGFERPLQTTALTVGSNSAVVVHGSALEAGYLLLEGTFIQTDFSQVKVDHLGVSRDRHFLTDPAAYFFTNVLAIGQTHS